MKKKLFLVLMLTAAISFGCGAKETKQAEPAQAESAEELGKNETADTEKTENDQDGNSAAIGNPWVSADENVILEKLGFDMMAPEGAKNIKYQMNESSGLGEMTFSYGEPELEYTFRMKSVPEFEDISGLHYDWEVEDDITIEWCEGKSKRAFADGKTIDLCLWCDMAPGMMYSLSTSAGDLDGFDITAVAGMMFVPTQGDVEGFIPSNFLEAKLQKDEFESFDDIISLLDKGNAYATVKVYGYDGDVLLIAEGAYDNGDGNMAAIEGSVYINKDGVIKNVGNVYSSGTAYPISIDNEGMLYSGGNHEVSVECISEETTAIMSMIYAYESFDEQGNATYGGFVREVNKVYEDGKEIDEKDPSVLQGLYEKFEKATPITYTVVE